MSILSSFALLVHPLCNTVLFIYCLWYHCCIENKLKLKLKLKHATCMLYTITMEMKLFLVPLNILVSLDQLKFVYKFCLRFTQVNSVCLQVLSQIHPSEQCFRHYNAVLSFCSLTDYDLALIPLIQTFLEICFVSYGSSTSSIIEAIHLLRLRKNTE